LKRVMNMSDERDMSHDAKLRCDAENVLTWEYKKGVEDPLMFGHLRRFAKEIIRLLDSSPSRESGALLDDYREASWAFGVYRDADVMAWMHGARAALDARLSTLERDAARMRWLSAGNCCESMPDGYRVWSGEKDAWYSGPSLSAAIDAALTPSEKPLKDI
jgi:hypothetical protein